MNINSILKKELEIISLSAKEEQEIKEKANNIVNLLKKKGFNAEIGGSLAKGTMIRKSFQDTDIFVVFDSEKETQKLESALEKLNLNFKKVHGSRDYFQILDKGMIFELIPVKKFETAEKVENKNTTSQKYSGNITDFSLVHVNYIKKQIKKNPKISDETKLAKAFCYAHGVYGAESFIKGFSGYALEILVIHFGSFLGFLKKIKSGLVLDPAKHFKNIKKISEELNESKLLSPVILIDPTYKFRNVLAGLSKETFERFLSASKLFLKSPNLEFFELKEINLDDLKKMSKKKKAEFVTLSLHTYKQEGDIAGTKMKKFFEFIVRELERKKQRVLGREFKYSGGEEGFGYLIIKPAKVIEVRGPPIENKQATASFKRIRKKIYKKGNFWYAKEKIDLEDIFNFLKRFEDEMAVSFELLQ